jgi:hypothetical protein
MSPLPLGGETLAVLNGKMGEFFENKTFAFFTCFRVNVIVFST